MQYKELLNVFTDMIFLVWLTALYVFSVIVCICLCFVLLVCKCICVDSKGLLSVYVYLHIEAFYMFNESRLDALKDIVSKGN